jgi:hypothetical protein
MHGLYMLSVSSDRLLGEGFGGDEMDEDERIFEHVGGLSNKIVGDPFSSLDRASLKEGRIQA